jgi:hypothetical protein
MTAFKDFRFGQGDDLADLGGPASRYHLNVAAIKLRLEEISKPESSPSRP